MGRLFALLLFITIVLIFSVGDAVYWISLKTVTNAKKEAAHKVANSIALSVSQQVHLLNKTLDNIAQQPEVIAAVASGNPVSIETVAENIKKYFPEALKIRLLLPNVNKVDESAIPHMGYADLDMVRESLNKNQAPILQGDMGPNRHLAMTSQIIQNNKVIGIVLASLQYDFIAKSIKVNELNDHYVELKQDDLVLGSAGISQGKNKAHKEEIKIPRTTWKLYYEYPAGTSLGHAAQLWIIISSAIGLAILGFFLVYRRLTKLLKDDSSIVVKAFKDIITHKSMGSYPVHLTEMNMVISSFIRLNRALEDSSGHVKTDEVDELEKNGFFSTPDNFDFPDMALDEISFDEPTTQQQTKAHTTSNANVPTEFMHATTIAQTGYPSPPLLEQAPPTKLSESTKTVEKSDKKDALSSLFRAYDIRGIVGQTLTLNTVYDIGRAFGTVAKAHHCESVVLGRDGRTSSASLAEELAKGIASTGCGIIDIGMIPTPVMYFAAQHIKGRSGIMVTGSHNPPDYNGFKMVIDGETLAENRIQDLKKCIDNRSYATGDMGMIEKNPKLSNEYIGTIADDIRIARPMLVVLDCGNGAAGKLGPTLLKTLGCEVIELHCEVDGTFPNHHPDPSKPENMAELATAVKHYKADLGIAFDGDGDRLGVVDSNGKIIWPDRQMMLFAKSVLAQKTGAEVIYDVKCSKHLPEQIKKYGGRPVMWKTGHALMKAKIKETGAKLAGEMSGHIFFNDRWFGFDDALYAAARLIEILSNDARSSAQVFAGFPDSINTPELTIELAEGENRTVLENMIAVADFIDAKIIDLDGIRVEFSDGWGLVRASNTTPVLTLRFEADTPDAMQNIQQRFRQLIHKVKPNIDLPF